MTDGSGTWREKTETAALPLAKFRRQNRKGRENRQQGTFAVQLSSFSCRISTPALTPRNVAANCDHGVLELTLPLTETAKPLRIAIGTGSNDTVENAA